MVAVCEPQLGGALAGVGAIHRDAVLCPRRRGSLAAFVTVHETLLLLVKQFSDLDEQRSRAEREIRHAQWAAGGYRTADTGASIKDRSDQLLRLQRAVGVRILRIEPGLEPLLRRVLQEDVTQWGAL